MSLRKWVGTLLTPSLKFTPATMNMREGFDLRLCRLWDGSALLYVPHGARPGMFCCEVESALDMHKARAAQVRVSEFMVWVNADGWIDWKRKTITDREMISINDRECINPDRRRLNPWMVWMIKWRMQRIAELDFSLRHYQSFHFMCLLNHLWCDIYREPHGFVERWALKGPEAAEEAWSEAVSIRPELLQKKEARSLFEVLKKEA
jgi:hypothetical protein